MKFFRSISRMLFNLTSSIKRFPLAMIFAILAAFCMAQTLNYRKVDILFIKYTRFGALFIAGIFLYSVIALYVESTKSNVKNEEDKKSNNLFKIILYFLSIPVMYGIYEIIYSKNQGFFAYENQYIYFGLIALFVVMASYIAKISYHKDFISYVANILESFVVSNVYSIVSFIGISAIIFAIQSLFSIKFEENIYLKLFYFTFIPYNVGIFLSGFPKESESYIDYDYPKSIKVLMIYVITPLVIIYTIILFIYFLKILVNWQIPDGIIVNLVLWYAMFSVFLQFFLGKINTKFIENFKRYYPFTLLPLLFMMFFSIGIRINEYGLTENRYFILAAGIWVFISEIYYIFYKKNSNIFIPFIFSVIILFSVIGPISCYRLSERSQINRLTKILEKNKMINGKNVLAKENISNKDKDEITSILFYLKAHYERVEIPYLDKNFEISDEMMKTTFGFNGEVKHDLENYHYDNNYGNAIALNIDGYSNLIRNVRYKDTTKVDNYTFNYTPTTIEIYFTKDGQKLPLKEINLKNLKDKIKTIEEANGIINPEDLSIIGENNGVKYKIIFNVIDFYGENDTFDTYVEFDLLTKELD